MPATSAPRARATLASSDSAPKLMSLTNSGISSRSGSAAPGPMVTSVPTGSSSSSGRVASWAVTIWIESHDGKAIARHAHRGDRAVMADLGQSVDRELADLGDEGFLGRAVGILKGALVRVAVEGLRMLAFPRRDLVGIDDASRRLASTHDVKRCSCWSLS